KWGNSFAVRIPRNLINSLSLTSRVSLDIREEDGKLILTPIQPKKFQLSEMIAQITPQNIHDEVDFGNETGNEVW
ncbi:MAG TPA: AbrB/MazE/SpoVT family DNA-binding domain-containing protein, partial [Bellilinea sp.]|nr:AbrB/MazE/SpoVT family DNA-binding domain-containing protein [Bellilinea sp.]